MNKHLPCCEALEPTSKGSSLDHAQSKPNYSSAQPDLPTSSANTPLLLPTKLCARCSLIDLDTLSGKLAFFEKGDGEISFDTNVIDLDTVEALAASRCPLCRFFALVADPRWSEDDPQFASLDVNCLASLFGFSNGNLGKDTVLLSVGHDPLYRHHLKPNHSYHGRQRIFVRRSGQHDVQTGIRKLSRGFFDEQLINRCLEYCEEHHGSDCKPRDNRLLKYLQVIDCEKLTIVTAPPDCRYAALSYVWGLPQSTEDIALLSSRSKTISDAITVTLKLKLRYLWVDKYCINQADEVDKSIQISQMDLIYSIASICIIAAAGDGPDYGLPGVNGTLRSVQPMLTLGHHILISGLTPAKRLLQSSKWASRGWTYQEGILARRRLVFTDDQVFFECNTLHYSESWILPLDELHSEGKEYLKVDFFYGYHRVQSAFQVSNKLFLRKVLGSDPWEIMAYLSIYSGRQLTYTEDRVKAVQGIFHAAGTREHPLYHFIGVPILPPICGGPYNLDHSTLERSPEEGFLIGLTWYHKTLGKRQSIFPSWSWAGWDGQLSKSFLFDGSWTSRLKDSKISIEKHEISCGAHPKEASKSSIRFPNTAGELPKFLQALSLNHYFLHIQTRMCICEPIPNGKLKRHSQLSENEKEMSNSNDIYKPEHRFLSVIIEGMEIYGALYPDTDDEDTLVRSKLHIMFLVDERVDVYNNSDFIGVVVMEKERYFERVGGIKFKPELSGAFRHWLCGLPVVSICLG